MEEEIVVEKQEVMVAVKAVMVIALAMEVVRESTITFEKVERSLDFETNEDLK